MQDNLEKLLKKINLDNSLYKYFEGGKLDRIVLNNTKDNCTVVLDLKDHLDLDLYLKIEELLNNYLKIKTKLNIISGGNTHKEF